MHMPKPHPDQAQVISELGQLIDDIGITAVLAALGMACMYRSTEATEQQVAKRWAQVGTALSLESARAARLKL